MSGARAGAESGAERPRKSDEREQDLKKYGGAGAERERSGSGVGTGGHVSGSGAVSGLNQPLTIRSNLTYND